MQVEQVYICDRAKKIGDGKCSGSGCAGEYCFMTKDKEYAKEYITIYEAKMLFESMVDRCILSGEQEKANQYANALKSINETIIELQKESKDKGNKFITSIHEQLSLFEELL